MIPGGEIFPALERRVLDAAEYSMTAIDKKLGFYRVAKYNYFPGCHQQSTVFEVLINRRVWNSLKKSQQTVMEMAPEMMKKDAFFKEVYLDLQTFREWPKLWKDHAYLPRGEG